MKRILILLILLSTVAEAQLERAGRRVLGRGGLSRAGSTVFTLYTTATTSTFDPSFAKNGTQTVTMTMSDTTYSGMSFSVVPANRGLTGTKQAIFDFAGGKGTVTTVDFNTDSCTGTIPNVSQFTALVAFYCSSNQLTGSIPSLTTNTALVAFYCYANQLTGYTASTIALTCNNFQAQTNQLPVASINQILADFAADIASRPATGTLNIGGTGNAAPTGQGLIDKAAIQSRGWTVTTN